MTDTNKKDKKDTKKNKDIARVLELNTGAKIPVVGLGTWDLEGKAEEAALRALEYGYRHIDTARIYNTEAEIGQALKKTDVSREDIFITTKLWNSDQGHDRALNAIDESLGRLDLEYVDLYLIHWPYTHETEGENRRRETWKAMEEMYNMGKAKAIGVSNYEIAHLQEMEQYAEIPPAMNQIEVHPFWYRKELIDYCHTHDIAVTDYSPLARTHHLNHPAIIKIAKEYEKSPAQVMLRWGLQLGNIVIPKSAKPKHIAENIDIFDFALSHEDMETLNALNKNESVV